MNDGAALVTGAGGVMGGAIARALAGQGRPLIVNDISQSRLDALVEELEAVDAVVHAHRADVTDRDEAERLVDFALARHDTVNALVNVVGGYRGDLYVPVLEIPLERFEDVVRMNLLGTFNLTQLLGPHLVAHGRSAIVNITSVAKDGATGQADYGAMKAAVVGFTLSCALELAPEVTVNAVAPGVIDTSVMDRMATDVREGYRARIPLDRFGDAGEVGDAVAFLVGDGARYITGETIHVSGGFFGWL